MVRNTDFIDESGERNDY